MKCHQRIIKEALLADDLKVVGHAALIPLTNYILCKVQYCHEHREFIKKYEWLGSVGNAPKWVFEARANGHLAGIVLLNDPIVIGEYGLGRNMEAFIQRGASASWAHPHLSSKLIMTAIRWMVNNTEKRVFSAFSDPRAGEIGTIYQACGFDFLGFKFGAKHLYTNKVFRNKPFTRQTLSRTSTFKRWCKGVGIEINDSWIKSNGFKDLSTIPSLVLEEWHNWQSRILSSSERTDIPPKGKYVLVSGANKRETKLLRSKTTYQKLPYPKRHD